MRETPAHVRVPVVEIAVETYRLVFGRLDLVLELGWLPLLVLLAATILPDLLLARTAPPAAALGFTLPDTIEAVVAIFSLNAFAVRWHQVVLYGRAQAIPAGLFRRSYARFLLYTAALYLVSLLLMAAIIAAVAGGIGAGMASNGAALGAVLAAGIASVLVWLVSARLALLFPAAALGTPLSPLAAWRLMRGNSWRLIGCGFLTCAPFVFAVATVLMGLLSAAHVGGATVAAPSLGFLLLRGITDTVTNFVIVALGATILCGFYRHIVFGRPPARLGQG